eukprot:6025585-Prymnesium_polylepis.2
MQRSQAAREHRWGTCDDVIPPKGAAISAVYTSVMTWRLGLSIPPQIDEVVADGQTRIILPERRRLRATLPRRSHP